MHVCLRRRKKSGSDPYARSTQSERGGQSTAICNSTCRHNRNITDSINDSWNQCHAADGPTHMPARFPALSTNCVRPEFDSSLCVSGVARSVYDFGTP